MKKCNYYLIDACRFILTLMKHQKLFWVVLFIMTFLLPSANAQNIDKLEQWANGKLGTLAGQGWVTGNVVASKAHFTECMTIPYRLEISGLTPGDTYQVKIGYDTKKGGAHAIDYLTTYDFDNNHNKFGHEQEFIKLFDGLTIDYSLFAMDSEQLPAPSSTPTGSIFAGVETQPTDKFNSLELEDRKIDIYGGTFFDVYYAAGDENVGNPEGTLSSYLTIQFVADETSVLLLWGGHIGSQEVWGEGFAATNIQGSPYHMFVQDCSAPTGVLNPGDALGGCGSKEVQLSASAVQSPPSCEVSDEDNVCASSGNIVFTATTDSGESFEWEIINTGTNASIVGSNTNSTVTVNPGTMAGTFEAKVTISLGVPGGSLGSSCSDFVTVYEVPIAAAGPDQANCDDGSFTLAGNAPAGFTGAWTVVSGTATITDAASATTMVTGVPVGTSATLRWTLTNDNNSNCTDFDEVILTNNPNPDCSILGGLPEICLDETLDLSVPDVYKDDADYTFKWSSTTAGIVFFPDDTSQEVNVSGFILGNVNIKLVITYLGECVSDCNIDVLSKRCVEQCTWTPGFWKNHPEEICGLLGGTVTKVKGKSSCSGGSQNIGFELCGVHYTLSAEDISCLFNYSSDTRGGKTPAGCTPEVVAIAKYFAPFPNGETLLHHILAAKLNLLYNGANFGNIMIGDLVCIVDVDGVNVPNIFNGIPDGAAGEIAAIDFCLSSGANAAELSSYIQPLTAFNECNNTCGLPSQVEPTNSARLTVEEEASSMKLRAYPVPFKEVLNVSYNFNYDTDITIRFFDIRGVLVINKEIKSYKAGNLNVESFNMKDHQDQVLFMQVSTSKEMAVKKIISTNKR